MFIFATVMTCKRKLSGDFFTLVVSAVIGLNDTSGNQLNKHFERLEMRLQVNKSQLG